MKSTLFAGLFTTLACATAVLAETEGDQFDPLFLGVVPPHHDQVHGFHMISCRVDAFDCDDKKVISNKAWTFLWKYSKGGKRHHPVMSELLWSLPALVPEPAGSHMIHCNIGLAKGDDCPENHPNFTWNSFDYKYHILDGQTRPVEKMKWSLKSGCAKVLSIPQATLKDSKPEVKAALPMFTFNPDASKSTSVGWDCYTPYVSGQHKDSSIELCEVPGTVHGGYKQKNSSLGWTFYGGYFHDRNEWIKGEDLLEDHDDCEDDKTASANVVQAANGEAQAEA
ncbi:hypothetical protein VTK56DRAFT_3405 [Thermocarpiscus australiensis]